jgi:hypothetical protein
MNTQDNLNSASRKAYALTRAVAAIYRTLGARVEEEVSVAGSRIDLFITLEGAGGSTIRCAVECKAYSKLVGLKTVKSFYALVHLLQERSLVDKAVLVSIEGFTANALNFGRTHHLELIRLSELQNRLRGREQEVIKHVDTGFEDEARFVLTRSVQKRVFVVMPFAKRFDDVYIIGIREVAEKLNLVVERADDIEHNNQILEVIQQKIRDYELIVADISTQNPNVFYEVGYAHAAGTPTIIVSSDQKPPFDLQSFNQIFYESLVDLRDKLEKRIRATLDIH